MKYVLSSIILFLLVTSCSARNQGSIHEQTRTLDLINIYFYRNGSHKVQPELINVQSDSGILNSTEEWAEGGQIENLPEFSVINRIFVFQFQYLNRDRTEDVYYMYITDVNNEQYLKKFESNLRIDIDPYDSTQNELILTKVGVENWRKVLPPELL